MDPACETRNDWTSRFATTPADLETVLALRRGAFPAGLVSPDATYLACWQRNRHSMKLVHDRGGNPIGPTGRSSRSDATPSRPSPRAGKTGPAGLHPRGARPEWGGPEEQRGGACAAACGDPAARSMHPTAACAGGVQGEASRCLGYEAWRRMTTSDFSAVAQIFERFRERHPTPGLAYAIVRDGEVLYQGEAGVASRNPERAVSVLTRFRIASMTKSFAAAVAFALRDEGLLELSAPAGEILPHLELSNSLRSLSVSRLLSMTADLPSDDPWGDRQLGATDAEYGALFALPYLAAEAGQDVCSYSNLGYMLLGRILSAVTGCHLHELIRRRLLAPLGMGTTTWNSDEGDGDDARGHENQGGEWRELAASPCRGDGDAFAGLWSTLADLARWIRFFTSAWQGDKWEMADAVLRKESRHELQCEIAWIGDGLLVPWGQRAPQRERNRYAQGLRCYQIGEERFVGHTGGLPGFGSHMRWHPTSRLGIVALANSTYAPVTQPAAVALEYLVRATPRVSIALPQALEQCGKLLLQVLQSPDEVALTSFSRPTSSRISSERSFDNGANSYDRYSAVLSRSAASQVLALFLGNCAGRPPSLVWSSIY